MLLFKAKYFPTEFFCEASSAEAFWWLFKKKISTHETVLCTTLAIETAWQYSKHSSYLAGVAAVAMAAVVFPLLKY